MKTTMTLTLAVFGLSLAAPALANACPPEATAAALKAHAGATVVACKQEVEDGKTLYEVKIKEKDGRSVELDVSTTGQILLTEEYVDVKDVPAAVMAAFVAKYPRAQATAAEKQTSSDGKVVYELAFGSGDAKKSATFEAGGKFLEEEEEGEEGQD